MVKYLLGIFTGVVLVFLLFGALILIVITAGTTPPFIENDSVLVINLHGSIPEHADVAFGLGGWNTATMPTLLEIHQAFQKATEDDRIVAAALYCGGVQIGWGKAQELRWAIQNFKKSGKPIRAFLEGASVLDYYIAVAADEISISPESLLDVKGLHAEVSFYKNTLEKIGIKAELERVGKYKSFVEPWSRSSMSEPFRKVINSMLDEVYGQFLEAVSSDRNMTIDELRTVIDTGPFVQKQALDAGLVDTLQYEDEFRDDFKRTLRLDELNEVNLSQYKKVSLDSMSPEEGNLIAVVYAVGSIISGEGKIDAIFGSDVLGASGFTRVLRRVAADEDIKAVIVRIDSPGGDVFASDRIWRAMHKLREKKPVVVSLSDTAASGGYYIAMADSPVLAYPGTVTGSIGVVYGKFNLRGLYDKLGVNKEIITRGRHAASLSDYRKFSPQEREKVRDDMNAFYGTFVRKVAESRGRPWKEIDKLAQGRTWMGSQAHANGLVDELGGFDRAIEIAKEAAGLDPKQDVMVIPYPAPKEFFELLLEKDWQAMESAIIKHVNSSFNDFHPSLPWPVLLRGGLMQIAPYSIEIR